MLEKATAAAAMTRVTPIRRVIKDHTVGDAGWNIPETVAERQITALDRRLFGEHRFDPDLPSMEEIAERRAARLALERVKLAAARRRSVRVPNETRQKLAKLAGGRRPTYHDRISQTPLVSAAAGSRRSPGPAR